MKVLLHTCCGPCAIYPVEYLREKELEVWSYFYNPNIHPYTEFVRRRETLEAYAQNAGFKVILDDEYSMEEFLRAVVYREDRRCRVCYAMRLRKTARLAKDEGYDCFTTTLLVSPYQKHNLIRQAGEAAADEYGIPFYYADFRPGYQSAVAFSKKTGMYRQQYCGCIYSEKERFYRQSKGGKESNV
jgi:hypothetical protein